MDCDICHYIVIATLRKRQGEKGDKADFKMEKFNAKQLINAT
jgi:hypothetical protein